MKTAVGTLKGDLSQFRELEAFAAFGSELDKVVPGRPRPRLPARRAAQAAAQQPDARAGAGRVALRRHQRLPRPDPGGGRAPLRARAARVDAHAATAGSSTASRPAATSRTWTPSRAPSRASPTSSRPATAAPSPPSPPRPRSSPPTPPSRPTRPTTPDETELAHGRWCRADPAPTHQVGAVDQEDHQGDGAHRRQPDPQGPAAGQRGAALQRADHRGDPQPGRRRRGEGLAPPRAARGDPHGGLRGRRRRPRPLRWLQHQRHPRRRARDGPPPRPRASRPASSPSARRPPPTSASAATSSTTATSASPTSPPTRTPAGSPSPSSQRFEDGEYDAVELAYTQFISAGVQRVQLKRFVPLETDLARRRREVRRPLRRLRVRARPRRDPRPPAPALRRGPPLRRPARGRRRRSSPPSSGP